MTTATFDAIVHRHRPDTAEHGRFCRSCGRPYPCDVRAIAAEIDATLVPRRVDRRLAPRVPFTLAVRRR